MVLASLIALAAFSVGCKPKAGGSCKAASDPACADPTTMLACQDAKYTPVPCRGKLGCADVAGATRCDISGNADGDPCLTESTLPACSPDGNRQVRCVAGKISLRDCPAAGHCKRREEKGATCDLGEPEIGAPCSGMSSPSCSFDKKSLFACSESKWVRHAACSGKNGCKGGELGAMCDASTVDIGSACGAQARGKSSCSLDRRSLVSCDGAVWKQQAACPGGQTCSFSEVDGECDERLGCLLLPKSPACK